MSFFPSPRWVGIYSNIGTTRLCHVMWLYSPGSSVPHFGSHCCHSFSIKMLCPHTPLLPEDLFCPQPCCLPSFRFQLSVNKFKLPWKHWHQSDPSSTTLASFQTITDDWHTAILILIGVSHISWFIFLTSSLTFCLRSFLSQGHPALSWQNYLTVHLSSCSSSD